MRILVTGGAGFIGSHLCERLLQDNNEVICLDNFFTGHKNNIRHLIGNQNFEVVRHDVTVPYHAEVDQIYNLACPASPVHYQYDPVKTIRTSVIGAINMLDLAKSVRARILQASTSEIYGNPIIHPQHESYWGNVNPIGIRACYDESKRCAETLFMDYKRQYGVDTRIVRIFNTYGERMNVNDGRVVSNFIVQALQDHDITIYGDGTQTRSFQYVADLITGIIDVMNCDCDGPVNLGRPDECTIRDLARLIIELTHSRSEIIYEDLPQDDPHRRQPDIRLAESLINYKPLYGLTVGIGRTIKYFKNELQIRNDSVIKN